MPDQNVRIDVLVGSNVSGMLSARGKSQAALGRILGLSRSTMSRKIHGEVSWTAEDLAHTSAYLQVPVNALFTE